MKSDAYAARFKEFQFVAQLSHLAQIKENFFRSLASGWPLPGRTCISMRRVVTGSVAPPRSMLKRPQIPFGSSADDVARFSNARTAFGIVQEVCRFSMRPEPVGELRTTMTKQGQITVPAEIRGLLGLKPYDQVSFAVEDGKVRLLPAAFSLATAHRSVPPLRQPLSDEEMTRLAKGDKAQRTACRLGTE